MPVRPPLFGEIKANRSQGCPVRGSFICARPEKPAQGGEGPPSDDRPLSGLLRVISRSAAGTWQHLGATDLVHRD